MVYESDFPCNMGRKCAFQGDSQLESVSLVFPEKDTQQDLSYYRCLPGQYFMPNEKQLNIILHHHPSASPTTFSHCCPTTNSSNFSLLHFQTRTLCSAMRRQMAIQLFIARMGSWIWQDIHARKLCKRVRTNRPQRTDWTYLTLEYSFECIVPFYSIANEQPNKLRSIPNSDSGVHETGCSCHFLYGPDTKEEHKQQIEKSLSSKMELKLEVIFYKKEGKTPQLRCAGMLRKLFCFCLLFN